MMKVGIVTKAWLMTKKDRPFDPQLYFEFRLYREFSSGIQHVFVFPRRTRAR